MQRRSAVVERAVVRELSARPCRASARRGACKGLQACPCGAVSRWSSCGCNPSRRRHRRRRRRHCWRQLAERRTHQPSPSCHYTLLLTPVVDNVPLSSSILCCSCPTPSPSSGCRAANTLPPPPPLPPQKRPHIPRPSQGSPSSWIHKWSFPTSCKQLTVNLNSNQCS